MRATALFRRLRAARRQFAAWYALVLREGDAARARDARAVGMRLFDTWR